MFFIDCINACVNLILKHRAKFTHEMGALYKNGKNFPIIFEILFSCQRICPVKARTFKKQFKE